MCLCDVITILNCLCTEFNVYLFSVEFPSEFLGTLITDSPPENTLV